MMIIYGVGHDLQVAMEKAKCLLKKDVCLVDSDAAKIGKDYFGYVVQSPEILADLQEGTMVAISSWKYFREIQRKIRGINAKLKCRYLFDVVSDGYCNLCGHTVLYWNQNGEENLTTHPHIIGAGLREGKCPCCGGVDRNRWVEYVLENYTDIYLGRYKSVLHFAPENGIFKHLSRSRGLDYYPCDLRPVFEYQVDITAIPFKDHKFDYIIANHILEHIPDLHQAISELKRCVKTDGTLVISFPIATDTDTFEDASVVTEHDRRVTFGQEDHVRLFGNDYKKLLEQEGLKVRVYTPNQILHPDVIRYFNFIEDDVVMLCQPV